MKKSKQTLVYESMTGFASTEAQVNDKCYELSIRSVNHKGLRVQLRTCFTADVEEKLKSKILKELLRGSVDINIVESEVDELKVEDEFRRWIEACERSGLPSPSWGDYFLKCREKNHGGTTGLSANEFGAIDAKLKFAVNEFKLSREKEGQRLIEFIQGHHRQLVLKLKKIFKLLPALHRQKLNDLKSRISLVKEELGDSDVKDLSKECAVLLERLDVSEECDRLKIHLDTFEEALVSKKREGKYLDFLCQEIFREINTLANKSSSEKISLLCIEMKTTLEKIREQVQNLI